MAILGAIVLFFDIYCYLCGRKRGIFVQTTKRNIFSLVLLSLVLLNIGATTLFVHHHHIDERIVAHSHPFSGNPEAHDHSASSLLLVARQAISEMRVAETLRINFVDVCVEFEQSIEEPLHIIAQDADFSSLRAPPVA